MHASIARTLWSNISSTVWAKCFNAHFHMPPTAMKYLSMFDKIDLHLIRVLHTVLTERSVSRAALRLGMYQPAVSASLKRLRELAGDPLLVRSGAGMVPTEAGLRMVEPAAHILRSAEMLFSDARSFDPATAQHSFSLAASDYLDPLFLPQLVTQVKTTAPNCGIDIHPLSADADFAGELGTRHEGGRAGGDQGTVRRGQQHLVGSQA